VSDRDPKFTNAFGMHLSRKVGMKRWPSIPKWLGKTERVNQYLRNLMGADQQDWVHYVDRAEFSCNVAMHLATKGSSFMVAYGVRSNLRT
jgi:hypothetical protein